jgi:N-formylglutamate amidohydrolase
MRSFEILEASGPIVATAIHAGHDLDEEVRRSSRLSPEERLREEDPFTDRMLPASATQVIGHASRFQVDLNRSRELAVYRRPEDAWGLDLWGEPPTEEHVERSLAEYDRFYEAMRGLLESVAERHGFFVVLDVHSYNHRRGGAHAAAEDPEGAPELNVGTGTLDTDRWGRTADVFVDHAREAGFDARENVRFRGGHFPTWVNTEFGQGCALALEFKKTFMDEWSARVDEAGLERIRMLLEDAALLLEDVARGVR